MSKEETTVSKSNFSIVRKISELLKLGDDGKLDSFLTRVVKTLKNEAKALKKNLDNMKFNHEQNIDSLNDELDDAQEALAASYLDIPVENVSTNANQVSFMDTYLTSIDSNVIAVEHIEERMEEAVEAYDAEVEGINEQVASLKTRLKVINKA